MGRRRRTTANNVTFPEKGIRFSDNRGAPFAEIELGFAPSGIGRIAQPPLGRRWLDIVGPVPPGRNIERLQSVDIEVRGR